MEWLTDLMSHEVFGTTISVLELLISFASLFGGGYAGVRVGAVSRMRLDDRRTLLDEHLPAIDSLAAEPMAVYEQSPEIIAHARQLLGATSSVADRVDLLPWLDRYEWAELENLLPVDKARTIDLIVDRFPTAAWAETSLESATTDYAEAWRRLRSPGGADPGDLVGRPVEDWPTPPYEVASEQFRQHLRYQLRPSVIRRLRTRFRMVKLAVPIGLRLPARRAGGSQSGAARRPYTVRRRERTLR